MAQRFVLYLDADRAAWLGADGRLARGDITQAKAAAGEREVDVLVASEQLLITSVRLPPIRQAQRRLQAAAFALEDQLVARVDSLHFALAPRPGADGQTAVAVIDDARMATLMASCREAGLSPARVVPDVLALPAPPADAWRIAVIDDHVLTRTGVDDGFAGERDLWPALAAGEAAPQRIVIEHAPPHDVEALVEAAGFNPAPALEASTADNDDAVLAGLLGGADTAGAIDLRQGAYGRASAMRSAWRPFKITAGLAAAWLVIAICARGVENWQLDQRIDRLHAQSVAAFRDAFPQVQTINDLRVQAEQNIRALRGSDSGRGGLFALLQATAETTGNAGNLRLQSLQYRNGALQLSLRGDNVQAVEALRAGFERQRRAALTIESTSVADDGVQIRASVNSRAGA